MWSFHGFKFAVINASSRLNLLYPKGFEVRKKSLERHFHEKITSRDDSKHGPCLMNNIINILVVLNLIVLQNSNNLLKLNDRFAADLRESSFRLFGTCCNNCFLDFLFYNNGGKIVIFACI